MRPGLLDRTVIIQNYTEAQDATGQPVQTWADLRTVRAKVTPLKTSERFDANRDMGVFTAVFTVRWLDSVTHRSRVVYDGKNYDVIAIRELGRRQWLELVGEVLE